MGLVLRGVMVPLVIILVHNRPENVGLLPDGDWKPIGREAARTMPLKDDEMDGVRSDANQKPLGAAPSLPLRGRHQWGGDQPGAVPCERARDVPHHRWLGAYGFLDSRD